MIRYIDQFHKIDGFLFRRTYFKDEFSSDDYANNKQEVLYNCTRHNPYGPAIILYNREGNIYKQYYFIDNILHRGNGPATIEFFNDETVGLRWFYNGVLYTNEVREWLADNKIYYKKMTEDDYNRMWFEIL